MAKETDGRATPGLPWDDPPDTDLDGQPAWAVVADFTAAGVVVEEELAP